MSSSSSVILPALYSIQKLLENQKNRYNGTLLDSVASSKQPSKNNADDFFAHLMQSLIQFNGSCMSLYETYKSKCYAARSYLALFILLILTVIGGLIGYYSYMFFINKKFKIQLKECMDKPFIGNAAFNICIILTISIYMLFVGISIFQKNMKIYKTVYNIPNNPHFSGDLLIEKEIHQITDMFVLDKIPDFNEIPNFTSTCPVIPYLTCKLKGWNTCTGSITNKSVSNIVDNMKTLTQNQLSPANGTCISQFNPNLTQPSTKCLSCLQNACGQTIAGTSISDLEAALYNGSRLPQGAIDPYILYRKLQRYDIAFQVARITDAVSYFNNFLLKENDMISASSSFEDTITNGIINMLSVNYCRITNLNISNSCSILGTTLSTFTSDECHATCISDSNYVASIFNTKSYQSTVYTFTDFQNMVFINAPNDTSLDVVIKYGTYANIACLVNNSNNSNIDNNYNFASSTNQICVMSYDQFQVGCFNSNSAFGCSPLPQTQSYSNLFIQQNITAQPTPSYINIMSIDFGTDAVIKAAVPTTFASLKNVFVQNTVNFMQQNDPTTSFNFNDQVITNITSKLTAFYNTTFSSVAVPLSDILDQVHVKLNQIKFADIDPSNPLTKYITYSRFISKFSALDQESFLNEFLYNVDEIRHTSSGLNYLYNIYDYSTESFHSKKNILDATYIIIIIVGILVLIRYGIKEFCNILELKRENYVQDLREVYDNDEEKLEDISEDKIQGELESTPKTGGANDLLDFIHDQVRTEHDTDANRAKETAEDTIASKTDFQRSTNWDSNPHVQALKDKRAVEYNLYIENRELELANEYIAKNTTEEAKQTPTYTAVTDLIKNTKLVQQQRLEAAKIADDKARETALYMEPLSEIMSHPSFKTISETIKDIQANILTGKLAIGDVNKSDVFSQLKDLPIMKTLLAGKDILTTIQNAASPAGLGKLLGTLSDTIKANKLDAPQLSNIQKILSGLSNQTDHINPDHIQINPKQPGSTTSIQINPKQPGSTSTQDIKRACHGINYKKKKAELYKTFIEEHDHKITKEAKSKDVEIWIDGGFKFMFLLMFIIVLLALFYSWKEKTNVVFNFNMSMLTSNGDTIVNNANSIFSSLIDDNIMNNKLITYSALSSTEFNDIDEDGQYHEIQQKAQIQTSTPIIISTSDDYTYIYDDLTGLIEAYNQCNMLLFNLQGNLPFPLLEVSLYSFMIIIIMILSLVLVMKMKPKDKLERLQILIKLKTKLESNMDIADEDLYFCQDEQNFEKQDIINAVKGIALILLPIFTVFFAVSLMQNTDDFTSGLYASTLFRDTQCYKI